MIIFKKIRFKNFMSYGNVMTELPLDKHHISVIVGKNGSGKCLSKETKINVRFKTKDAEEKFKKMARH